MSTTDEHVTPLGTRYCLHESGLLIQREPRRVVDANGQHGRNVGRFIENYKERLSHIYGAGFPTAEVNSLDATTKYPDLADYVDMSEFLMCTGCHRFCVVRKAHKSFMEHLQASPMCWKHQDSLIWAYGSFFVTNDRKAVFIVMEKGRPCEKKDYRKRNRDEMDDWSGGQTTPTRPHANGRMKQEYPPQQQYVEPTLMTVPELVSQVHDYVYNKAKQLEPNMEYLQSNKNPRLESLISEYFSLNDVTARVLPYVLLDCVTDDLWNDDTVSDTFRFLLSPLPQLTVYDSDESIELKLRLSCSGVQGSWGCTISLLPTGNSGQRVGRFTRADHLEFTNLSYLDVCQILVTFRGIMTALLRSKGAHKLFPDACELTDFLTRCYEEVSCGPQMAELAIKEQLYFHVGRTSAQ